jgi:hypothetical protein
MRTTPVKFLLDSLQVEEPAAARRVSTDGCLSRALALRCNSHLLTVGSLLALAVMLQVAQNASAEVKDIQPLPSQSNAVPPQKETVPAETADCARMPTEAQKAECIRQHPYTGHNLLPDEKDKSGAPIASDPQKK